MKSNINHFHLWIKVMLTGNKTASKQNLRV